MISVAELFENAFIRAEEKSWDRIAVAVDLHGTVLKSNYSHALADEFYPFAEEALVALSRQSDVLLYMYSCTPSILKDMYNTMLRSKGIHIYPSPKDVHALMDVQASLYQSFNDKPYFNVLLEDKAGFDPNHDWEVLLNYLNNR